MPISFLPIALALLAGGWTRPVAAQPVSAALQGPEVPVAAIPRWAWLPVGEALTLDPDQGYAMRWFGKAWSPEAPQGEEIEWGPVQRPEPPLLRSAQVARWEGPGHPGTEAGDAWVVRWPGGAWGHVRLLHKTPAAVALEFLPLGSDQELILADALDLRGASEPGGYHLQWNAEPGTTYLLRRWVVGSTEPPEEVARIEGSHFFDGEAPRGMLLEYAVTALGPVASLPSRVRLVRQEHPPEWPVEVEPGLGLHLVTGELHGLDPHIVVQTISGARVFLRCADDCWVLPTSGPGWDDSWRAPVFEERSYAPNMRPVDVGSTAYFYLRSSGLYGRLRIDRDEQGRLQLTRQLAGHSGRVLPLPPRLAHWSSSESQVDLTFEAVSERAQVELKDLERIVEFEPEPGSGRWEVLAITPLDPNPSSVALTVLHADLPVVPLRFRHRYRGQALSLPSEPIAVLALDGSDPQQAARVRAAALEALASERFEQRVLGERVLRSLGPLAWDALLAMYRSGEGVAADAARQILLSPEGLAGGQWQRVLQAAGEREGLTESVPSLWAHPDPTWRLYQILLDHGRPEGTSWLPLMARLDPDERVRAMAKLLLATPERPAPIVPSGVAGWWALRGTEASSPGPWPDWRWELDGLPPGDAGATIRRQVDGGDAWAGHALLALAREAENARPAGALETDERTLLGLGLVGLHREERRAILLEALRSSVVSPGASLLAWRDWMDVRTQDDSDPAELDREVVRLEEPSLTALQQTLAEWEVAGAKNKTLILPSGLYGAESEQDTWIEVGIPGLALIGEGGVQLRAGLRVTGVRDLVLADLALDHATGSALSLTGATASLRNVTLSGAQTVLSLQDSIVELEACRVEMGAGKPSSFAARLMGPSLLLARGTRWRAGSLLLGDQGYAVLERCTLDSGERTLFQGQRGGYVGLLDCAILEAAVGFQGVQTVQLEGVLSTLRQQTIGSQNDRVYLCAEHVHAWEPWESWSEGPGVEVRTYCPIASDR